MTPGKAKISQREKEKRNRKERREKGEERRYRQIHETQRKDKQRTNENWSALLWSSNY
jgi:hypothetical protein